MPKVYGRKKMNMWEYLDEKFASPFSTLKIPSIIDDCHRQRKIIKKDIRTAPDRKFKVHFLKNILPKPFHAQKFCKNRAGAVFANFCLKRQTVFESTFLKKGLYSVPSSSYPIFFVGFFRCGPNLYS